MQSFVQDSIFSRSCQLRVRGVPNTWLTGTSFLIDCRHGKGKARRRSRHAGPHCFRLKVFPKDLLLVLRDRLAGSRIKDQGLALIIIAVPLEIEHLSDGICD